MRPRFRSCRLRRRPRRVGSPTRSRIRFLRIPIARYVMAPKGCIPRRRAMPRSRRISAPAAISLRWRMPTPSDSASETPAPTVQAAEPPGIPHPVEADTDCKACHDLNGAKPYPENHVSFTNAMCRNCHQPLIAESVPTATLEPTATSAPTATRATTPTSQITPTNEVEEAGEPPVIPHVIQEGIACTTCHGPNGLKPYPENHVSFADTTCTGCHSASEGQADAEEVTPSPTASDFIGHAAAHRNPPRLPRILRLRLPSRTR